MCSASQWECALFFCESHAHGARGKPYFSPVTPFRPACCIEACGTQCGGCGTLPCGRLSGLRPLEPPASALLRRDKPGPETKWRCRNMPAGATRPLRARHRRASPRVLEFAQGSSARRIAEQARQPTISPTGATRTRHRVKRNYHSTWRTATFLPVSAASRAARQVKTLRIPS